MSRHRSTAVLVVALGLACLPACESAQGLLDAVDKPGVRLAGVRPGDLSLDGITLNFDLDISNPYTVPLPVAAMDFALASGGSRFLDGTSETQGVIPARGSRILPLACRLGFAETLKVLPSLRPGALFPYDAEVGVSVDAPGLGRLRLPVSHQGNLPIPAVPEIALPNLQLTDISLTRVAAVLDLGIRNTNAFPIDISDLGYALDLAGRRVVSSRADNPGRFESGAARTLRIPVEFSPGSLGLGLLDLLRGAGSGYRMEGTMQALTDFGPLALPFTSSGSTTFRRSGS